MDEREIYFLKLDKKLIICYKEGIKNSFLSFDFKSTLENNIDIDLYEIISLISKKSYQSKDGKYSIYINKERYAIKLREIEDIIYLDDLLIKFFEKISHESIINERVKFMLIHDMISYDLILIIQQTALINGIDIIHTIDTNKSLRFFILSLRKIPFKEVGSKNDFKLYSKSLKENSSLSMGIYTSIIILYNQYIDIAIYNNNQIKKLFANIIEKPSFLVKIKLDFRKGYILLDKFNEEKLFKNFKEFIMKIIENEMGKQIFQDIGRIYVFDADNNNLNKFIFLGAFNSLKTPRTQQCTAIFNIIDKDNKIKNKISEFRINKCKYNITKRKIPILLDLELPYEGCFYLTVKLTLLNDKDNDEIYITVYFNQINYYYISLKPAYINSIEFIFYKTFPNKLFESNNYEDISYEENFENNELFKRICLINVNRKKFNFIKNKEMFEEIFDEHLEYKYKNFTVVFGEDLIIFSFYKKDINTKFINPEYNILDELNVFLDINSNMNFESIQKIKNELSNKYFNIKFIKRRFDKKFSNIINKNISLLISYGKFNIFEGCFVKIVNNLININYDKNSFAKFKSMMKQLELFIQKCNNLIKNKLTIGKLYLTACYALKDFLESGVNIGLNKDLIDIINFRNKETIYYSGYENNLEFILKLNKESFLYPILLQFNSGFKIFKYYEKDIPSCMVSKITLQQIKLDLIRSLDHYGVRISFDTSYLADTCLNTGITIYNEKKIFGKKLDEKEILTKFDTNYHKRTSISFLQKHERFCHFKKTFNKNELNYLDSPRGYIDFKDNIFRILYSKIKNKEEIGETMEFFLSGGNIELINNLYNYRGNSFYFKDLFCVNLLLEKSNENLIKILTKIPKVKENINNQGGLSKYKKDSSNEKYKKINSEGTKNETDKLDEHTEEKSKILNKNSFRKYTFPKNTIYCEVIDYEKYQIVPDNKRK